MAWLHARRSSGARAARDGAPASFCGGEDVRHERGDEGKLKVAVARRMVAGRRRKRTATVAAARSSGEQLLAVERRFGRGLVGIRWRRL